MKRSQWVEDRMGELLPTTYFHLVFTLPQELRSLCMGNRTLLFSLLFKAARHTILTLSKDEKYIGATPGIVSILHTHVQRTPLEHSKNKMERIAAVCRQLKLPAPMQRAHTPLALRLLLQTGKDITLCPVCGRGRMELVKTFIFHNGCLIDAAQLRNRGSPKIKSNYTQ